MTTHAVIVGPKKEAINTTTVIILNKELQKDEFVEKIVFFWVLLLKVDKFKAIIMKMNHSASLNSTSFD